jgi:site-specific recombinase XerD
MFETLFTYPLNLARHRTAPCPETREAFLIHCAEQGYPHASLKKIAWILLVFSQSIDLCRPGRITAKEIEYAVDHRIRYARRPEGASESRSSQLLFIHIATAWLRFCGYVVVKEHAVVTVFDEYIEKFTKFMRDERGLSNATITFNCEQLTNFVKFAGPDKTSLNDISIHDVDAYLVHQGNHGWSRRSLHSLADALRAFFRYAETQHWVKGIAEAIDAPHLYAQETLPLGPTWEEVKQLIDSFSSDSASDLRARAIVLLLAVYGLRRGEVAGLHLDDVDWVGEILHVTRPKQRCTQQYPLDQTVGDAILRYIKEARPHCAYHQLFLTLDAPIRPLRPNCISPIVRARLKILGIDVKKKGSHCLRHACARHLLDAGFSLKQIGDQLGHRTSSATREYVKVDLNGLRQIAELDLGDLL